MNLKKYPFKIGDTIITPEGDEGYITEFATNISDLPCYCVKLNNNQFILCHPKHFKLKENMKEERNITLTLDKAKEWYKQGGELKEIALQAFKEYELNPPLPRSWEEYCKMYPVPDLAFIFGSCVPNKYVTLWKLEQLRDCYRQGWKPTFPYKDDFHFQLNGPVMV